MGAAKRGASHSRHGCNWFNLLGSAVRARMLHYCELLRRRALRTQGTRLTMSIEFLLSSAFETVAETRA